MFKIENENLCREKVEIKNFFNEATEMEATQEKSKPIKRSSLICEKLIMNVKRKLSF